MGVNNVNFTTGAVWTNSTPEKDVKTIDIASMPRPANADKFVLQLPVTETIYKRNEFVHDKSMSENIACCYSYMERTLTFADGSTLSTRSNTSCLAINLSTSRRNFGKSGVDMYELSGGVEETWETIERSASQTSLSGSISVGDLYAGYSEKTSVYSKSSVSETAGSVAYKNGAIGKYTENAVASHELYNKCAKLLAGSFGEDETELTLSERDFVELFAPIEMSSKQSADKLSKQLEKLDIQRKMLKDFMDRQLEAAKKKDPDSEGVKAFADMYRKLSEYSYTSISAMTEKIFSFEYA